MELQFKRRFNEKDLPDVKTLVSEAEKIAKNVTIGESLFMKTYKVKSEAEYKRKMMSPDHFRIMKHSHIGWNSVKYTEEGFHKIYDELLFRIRNGEALSPGVLAARLTPDEMSLFVAIQGGTVDMANADRAMADYIKIIAARKDQQMDLRELAEQKRKKVSEGKP